MEVTADGTVLLWFSRHFSLEVDDYPTVEQAMAAARYGMDDGRLMPVTVELLDTGEALAWDDADRRYPEPVPVPVVRRPITTEVTITSPHGVVARYGEFHDAAEAEAFIAPLKAKLGDRIVVVPDRWRL